MRRWWKIIGSRSEDVDVRGTPSIVAYSTIAHVRLMSSLIRSASCVGSISSEGYLRSSCLMDASVSEVVVCCELRGQLFARMCW